MIKYLRLTIRDWWRGYSDGDLWSLMRKLEDLDHVVYEYLELTRGEWMAIRGTNFYKGKRK